MQQKQADMTPRLISPVRKGRVRFGAGGQSLSTCCRPCDNACPAGEHIQAWLALAQAGKFRAAWEALVGDNPLPAVHGRVCYHPCESGCNRGAVDAAVNIHAVERFLGDLAAAENWPIPSRAPPSGKRVLIVGAGPSGLLGRLSSHPTGSRGRDPRCRAGTRRYDAFWHPGLSPAPRRPADGDPPDRGRWACASRSITKSRTSSRSATAASFDAVFVAIGADVSRHVEIPARDAPRVLDAVPFLRDADAGEAPRLGRRVIVYGGGNTAMDAARTASRLGADEALIIYHRDRAHMPAHAFEADEAIEEGVKIKWLTSIKEIIGPSLRVERMTLDENGRPSRPAKSRRWKPTPWCWPSASRRTAASCDRFRASNSRRTARSSSTHS